MFPMTDDIQDRLQACCDRVFPRRVALQVRDVADITAGWESELYSFTLEHGPGGQRQSENLILRLYPGDGTETKSAHEFHSLKRLHKAGYPVPRAYVLERENSRFGKPFVMMERIEGQVMLALLSASTGEDQERLLAQFCGLFVQLHRLDWRRVAETSDVPSGDPYVYVDRWLRAARANLARFPETGLLPALEWLEKQRDQFPCPKPSPVHQDFHPSNVIVRANGTAVVIDWTGFDISDSRFDLGWTLMLVDAYAGAELRNRILQGYERRAGAPVEQIEAFVVFACLRRLLDLSVSISVGAGRRGMRPEALEMMKQDSEAHKRVYDFLLERTGIRMAEVERLLASFS